MSSKKTKIAVALLSSLFLFSGVGVAATESSGESESQTEEFTVLGSGGESFAPSNSGADFGSIHVIDSGIISSGLDGMASIISQAVDREICSPPSNLSDASYCFMLLDAMNYRYGSAAIDESTPDYYASSFSPEQNLLFFAAATGDIEAQAILFSQDPDLWEYASPYEREQLYGLASTNLAESDIVNRIWENHEQLKRDYLSAFSDTPIEEWERLGWLKDFDNPTEFVMHIPSSERIEYTDALYERKETGLNEMNQEWRDEVAAADNISDTEKSALITASQLLESPTGKVVAVGILGGAVLLGGVAVKKLFEPKYLWYSDQMENIKANPKD